MKNKKDENFTLLVHTKPKYKTKQKTDADFNKECKMLYFAFT